MKKPWIDGPSELLQHGLEHLYDGSEFDLRIAMISIDNSVELMLKTYLGLPKRFTGITGLTRKEFEEASNSFPALLDLTEKYVPDKITDLDLADIEWFHRLRNQLYHSGNGITVEKSKVESYSLLAQTLFKNLFETSLTISSTKLNYNLKGEFLDIFNVISQLFRDVIAKIDDGEREQKNGWMYHRKDEVLGGDLKVLGYYEQIRKFRNEMVHVNRDYTIDYLKENIEMATEVQKYLKNRLQIMG